MTNRITVETTVEAPVEKVWIYWSEPKHVMNWCSASSDWHAPKAENDLCVNGKFKTHMAAKDGSVGFDFEGIYTSVIPHKNIEYKMADGREVVINFTSNGKKTTITETFDAENENPLEMQKGGWQAILDNFKKYTEAH